jgi:phosphoglycerate dehydrogenase-like enzyme
VVKPLVVVAPHFRSVGEIFRPEALDRLHDIADVVWGRDEPVPQALLEDSLAEAVAVVFGTWSYGDALRRSGPQMRAALEVLGAHDHHEMDYRLCFERGIEVGSAAPAFGPAVAELGLGLTLAATRGITGNDRAFRTGSEAWLHDGNRGFDALHGGRVGFVGCGGLSVHLQALLAPFEVEILGYDPFVPPAALERRSIRPATLEQIFETCDVVYVLAAPTEANRHLVDAPLLDRLGPRQTLVLLSRASLVDFDHLTRALLEGRFRAAIDVFPTEPLPGSHPIRSAEAAVLSSHRAGAVPKALLAIGDMVVDDLDAILDGRDDRRLQYLTPGAMPALLQPKRTRT